MKDLDQNDNTEGAEITEIPLNEEVVLEEVKVEETKSFLVEAPEIPKAPEVQKQQRPMPNLVRVPTLLPQSPPLGMALKFSIFFEFLSKSHFKKMFRYKIPLKNVWYNHLYQCP